MYSNSITDITRITTHNISDDELNKLADLIVKKITARNNHAYLLALEEEELLGEYARLTTMLQLYESNEKYEKAAIIQRRIDRLNVKLKKLQIQIKDHDRDAED